MLAHDSSFRNFAIVQRLMPVVLLLVLLPVGCTSSSDSKNEDSTKPAENETTEFHADNDIAMTVRSLADAIRVGEPLDSTEYDFEGILTDGQGTPLYTDVQGSPGIWVVDVLDGKNATIRNLYLGDLLPADLEAYLLQSLLLTENDKILFTAHDAVNDEETDISVYDFNGGYLRFEIRAGFASNGLEGPLLTIIMSADPPVGAETQKEV